MLLNKSDFLNFKTCASYAWFVNNKPEILSDQEIDPFVQGLIDQGEEVESWARKLYPEGIHVKSFHTTATESTKNLIDNGVKTIFQATFSDGELYAMIDILLWNALFKAWDIIEVKSSSSQQDQEAGKRKNEHLDDAGFQRILLQRLGLRIANVYLLQLNKEYVRQGPVNVKELFAKIEITDQLIELEEQHQIDILDAIETIHQEQEPHSCACKYKSRKNHCGAFSYLYPEVPDYAVYDLHKIGNSKRLLREMVDKNIIAIDDIVDDTNFKKMKLWQWHTYVKDEEIILKEEIKRELESLAYPLYFLDYETLPSAIPRYDGTSPHQHVIFQYSLHIIDKKGGDVVHKEYLHTETERPMEKIANNLIRDLGTKGSIIVWYKAFESPRTKELANCLPAYSLPLLDIEDRMYDLMDIISKGYYHHKDFKGSASIKSVLPVMCPDLDYKTLQIQNGGQAMTTYSDLIFTDKYKDNKNEIIQGLLDYCKMDT